MKKTVGFICAALLAPLMNITIITFFPALAQAQAIEEIVVTARKKEESLQEVPISISAFSGEQMRERGIQSNYDVASFTPNFNTQKMTGRDLDRPTIRGMAAPSSRGDPNASYFIDGTYVARTIATASVAAMERVEVIRGPQSTQFGRATFAGAINYVTRKPTNEFTGQLNVRAGTSEDYQFSGWFSGPIIQDKLLYLVSAGWDSYGGQWNNQLEPNTAFTNPPPAVNDDQNTEGDTSAFGEEETKDFLVKLTWLPFDSTEVNLKVNYTDADDGHWPSYPWTDLNCLLPDGLDGDPVDICAERATEIDPGQNWKNTSGGTWDGEFKILDGMTIRRNIPDFNNGFVTEPIQGELTLPEQISAPVKPGLRRETTRLLGEWIQDIGEWTSTLKMAYSEEDFISAYDLDHQEVRAVWGLFNFNNEWETEDLSVEYSIETPANEPFRAKLGVYYYDQDFTDRQRSLTGPLPVFGLSPGGQFQDDRLREVQNSSVFGGFAIDLSDQWTFEAEARYAEDDLDITSGQRSGATNESMPVSDSLSFSSFTPRFTLNFFATDDMMAYVQIANGTKPGGFNTEFFRSDVPAEYTNYIVNCDVNNPGVAPPVPGDFEYACTEDQKRKISYKEEEQWTYEVGVKSSWMDRRITANLSVFYIDWTNQALFEVTEFPNVSGAVNTSTILNNAGQSEIWGLELETNFAATDNLLLFANYGWNDGEYTEGNDADLAALTGSDGDLSGNTIPNSPQHNVVFGFDASTQVSTNLEGFMRSDFLYESKRYTSSSNFGYIGERKIVNLRLGLRTERWTLTGYVRNLTNDDTPVSVLNFVNFAVDEAANGVQPNMYAPAPQRGRDAGLEFQWFFGD